MRKSTKRRMRRWLKRASVALALLLVLAMGAATLRWRAEIKDEERRARPVTVPVILIERQEWHAVRESFEGEIEASRRTGLSFNQEGLLANVRVETGQEVEAGEILAELDVEPLSAERKRLEDQLREIRDELGAALGDDARSGERALLEARATDVASAIRRVNLTINRSRVRAPFDGVVTDRLARVGQHVSKGERVLNMARRSMGPKAVVDVPPEVARALVSGSVFALRAGGEALNGAELSFVRSDLNASTRTLPVLFDLSAVANAPKGGKVELTVEREVQQPGFWLPTTALKSGGDGLWTIFEAVGEPGREVAAPKVVTLLSVGEGKAFVRGATDEGAMVIAGNLSRINRGQRVDPLPEQLIASDAVGIEVSPEGGVSLSMGIDAKAAPPIKDEDAPAGLRTR